MTIDFLKNFLIVAECLGYIFTKESSVFIITQDKKETETSEKEVCVGDEKEGS